MQGWIAGVDEAGRGPLAGPVVAAAVILCPDRIIEGLADSKTLTAARRVCLAEEIKEKAIAWGVGRADVNEIDRLNIFHATMLAMQRAIAALAIAPSLVQIDGNRCPVLAMPSQAIVKGDALVPAISAASILAKVLRDSEMQALDTHYPGYGFAKHKGYCTSAHMAALMTLGACPIHRRSFEPVQKALGFPVKEQCRASLELPFTD